MELFGEDLQNLLKREDMVETRHLRHAGTMKVPSL